MSTIQVDRIIPYQSSSVTIEGGIVQADAATTGSNTFTGDQNIQGTLTASLQEGYAWVGGAGNVSTLAATSSFGGGGSGFPFEGDAVITGSLSISGSAVNDLSVEGREIIFGASPRLTVSSSVSNVIHNQQESVYTVPGQWNAKINSESGFEHGKVSNGNYIGITVDNASYGNTGWAGPGIAGNDPSDSYPVLIGFQDKTNWTDGTVTILKPLDVSGSVEVSGSATITGDLTVTGLQRGRDILLDDPGATTSLFLNPDFNSEFIGIANRWYEGVNKAETIWGEETAEILLNGWSGSAYDEALYLTVDGGGVSFKDWDGGYTPQTWLNIPQKLGRPSFKRSVDFEQVIKLTPQDPLPAGALGELSVSGSALYFHDGSSWRQVSLV